MKKLLLFLLALSCEDKFLTVERRIIDAENNIPIYFQASAEQDGIDTWRPVFTYYIYQIEVKLLIFMAIFLNGQVCW